MKSMLDSETDSFHLTRQHLLESLRFPFVAVGLLWLVHLWQVTDGFDPGAYGIMSRRAWGLRGIVTAPLIHGSWKHLISNTVPLFVLTFISLYFYRKVAMRAFWLIYFVTGAAVWLFARPVSHIGASGIIYGLVSFMFWNGIFRRSLRSIILAAIVMLLYSGMFLGVLPEQEGISWESHLIGSLAGIFAAFLFKGELEDEEEKESENPFANEHDEEKTYFLPQDIFEKTKVERLTAEAQRAKEAEEARQQIQNNNPFNNPPFWNQSQTW
ncbi:MAG: rhomboid family intramembrane serine protease [Phycisphaerae bacterium]|nr:rhomboid family intramembrane serine protease [Saprospiraceae bacterium]